MGLPKKQQISGVLHQIADLVQEADDYLRETIMFKGPKPLRSLKPKPKKGLEPFKADGLSLSARRMGEKLNPPKRDALPAARERRARSLYQKNKSVTAPPRKALGSRMRFR